MNPKVVTIVQARRGSSRFPDKILKKLGDKTILERIVERIQQAKLCGEVIVATTQNESDDIIEMICLENKITYFRGNETDLLDRHYKAALLFGADSVVKIPSDCPLIDPKIIDKVLQFYLENYPEYDFVSNLHPATWPDGNDVEVMHFSALKISWQNAQEDFEREHTTPYIWENKNLFKLANVEMENNQNYAMSHRYTIDYEEDYQLIKNVFDILHPQNPFFGVYDVLKLLEEKPQLLNINKKYAGVNWYRHHLSQLKTVSNSETRFTESEKQESI